MALTRASCMRARVCVCAACVLMRGCERQAKRHVREGANVAGVIVARDFQYTIVDPMCVQLHGELHRLPRARGLLSSSWCRDVETCTELVTHQVKQVQHIPFRQVRLRGVGFRPRQQFS